MYLTSWKAKKGYKAREKKHVELWSAQPPEIQAFRKCSTQLSIKNGDSITVLALWPMFPHSSAKLKYVSSLMKAILTPYTLAVNYQIGSLSNT